MGSPDPATAERPGLMQGRPGRVASAPRRSTLLAAAAAPACSLWQACGVTRPQQPAVSETLGRRPLACIATVQGGAAAETRACAGSAAHRVQVRPVRHRDGEPLLSAGGIRRELRPAASVEVSRTWKRRAGSVLPGSRPRPATALAAELNLDSQSSCKWPIRATVLVSHPRKTSICWNSV